jgi:hypothetical protein
MLCECLHTLTCAQTYSILLQCAVHTQRDTCVAVSTDRRCTAMICYSSHIQPHRAIVCRHWLLAVVCAISVCSSVQLHSNNRTSHYSVLNTVLVSLCNCYCRWRVDPNITYGTHMALSQSYGLLFLQSGLATLKRDPLSIAALLTALFPHYPATTSDNRFHLQALRHMYVLAVEKRCVEAVDVDTGAAASVPLLSSLLSGETVTSVTPCPLPELHSIASITVSSQQHLPLTLHTAGDSPLQQALLSTLRVYVKRRAVAAVADSATPAPQHALAVFKRYCCADSSNSATTSGSSGDAAAAVDTLVEGSLVARVAQGAAVEALTGVFASTAVSSSSSNNSSSSSSSAAAYKLMCEAVWRKAVAADSTEAVSAYLRAQHLILRLRRGLAATTTTTTSSNSSSSDDTDDAVAAAWNLRLLIAHYRTRDALQRKTTDVSTSGGAMPPQLLCSEFVESLRIATESALSAQQQQGRAAAVYYGTSSSSDSRAVTMDNVAALLCSGDVSLDDILKKLSQ